MTVTRPPHVSRITFHASRILNTNLNTPIPAARGISGEGWAAIAGAASSAFLFGKKLLGCKSAKSGAGQPGRVLRRNAGQP